jgi:antitoxin VapB
MMTKTLQDVMEHAATWPREDQEALVEYAREIEARRTGITRPRRRLTTDEMLAVGDEIVALPLLDPRSPRQIKDDMNAL